MVEGLKDFADKAPYGPGDTLVVFGEIFSRGYVNGLVDLAKAQGMKVLEGTVGRRDNAGNLRPLSQSTQVQFFDLGKKRDSAGARWRLPFKVGT